MSEITNEDNKPIVVKDIYLLKKLIYKGKSHNIYLGKEWGGN